MSCNFLSEKEDILYCNKYKREISNFDCKSCQDLQKLKKDIILNKKNNTQFKFRIYDYNFYKMYDWNTILIRFPNVNIFTCPYFKVMQYIGSSDKNNVDIYEGDIIQVKRFNGNIERGIIQYDFTINAFIIKPLNDWQFTLYKECEVIGNIYENPELLEIFF